MGIRTKWVNNIDFGHIGSLSLVGSWKRPTNLIQMTEKLDSINESLRRLFGLDTVTGKSIYRVVWANDQYEQRLTKYTDYGIELLVAEVRELPKYAYLKDLYVLERLTIIPDVNAKELPTQKLSYEPLWSFVGQNGDPIPPTLLACKFIIDTVRAATGKESLAGKYSSDPDMPNAPITNAEEFGEHELKRLRKLQDELFGDEPSPRGESVVVPDNYSKSVH